MNELGTRGQTPKICCWIYGIRSEGLTPCPQFVHNLIDRPYKFAQKMYFRANCIMRGPPLLLVILPNWPPLRLTTGLPSRRLLVTLNASARNSTCWPSETLNFRDTV